MCLSSSSAAVSSILFSISPCGMSRNSFFVCPMVMVVFVLPCVLVLVTFTGVITPFTSVIVLIVVGWLWVKMVGVLLFVLVPPTLCRILGVRSGFPCRMVRGLPASFSCICRF